MKQHEVSRNFYMLFRKANKLPVVHHTRISKEICVCHVKGTDFEIEIYNATNAWEAKLECLQKYTINTLIA